MEDGLFQHKLYVQMAPYWTVLWRLLASIGLIALAIAISH